jgi:hypothetical protein
MCLIRATGSTNPQWIDIIFWSSSVFSFFQPFLSLSLSLSCNKFVCSISPSRARDKVSRDCGATIRQENANLSLLSPLHEVVCWNGGITPLIPKLYTEWVWIVSFIPWPTLSPRKDLRYTLHRILGRPQSRFGRCEEEKNLLSLRGIEFHSLGHPLHNVVPILTELVSRSGVRPHLLRRPLFGLLYKMDI